MSEFSCGVAEDSGDAAGIAIGVDESGSLDTIVTLPFDGEAGIGLLQVDRFGIPVSGQTGRRLSVMSSNQASPVSVENRMS